MKLETSLYFPPAPCHGRLLAQPLLCHFLAFVLSALGNSSGSLKAPDQGKHPCGLCLCPTCLLGFGKLGLCRTAPTLLAACTSPLSMTHGWPPPLADGRTGTDLHQGRNAGCWCHDDHQHIDSGSGETQEGAGGGVCPDGGGVGMGSLRKAVNSFLPLKGSARSGRGHPSGLRTRAQKEQRKSGICS